jgi:hypothetical protein
MIHCVVFRISTFLSGSGDQLRSLEVKNFPPSQILNPPKFIRRILVIIHFENLVIIRFAILVIILF